MATQLCSRFRLTSIAHTRAFSQALALSQPSPSTSKSHFSRDHPSQAQYDADRPRTSRPIYLRFESRKPSSRGRLDEHEEDRHFRVQHQHDRSRAPRSANPKFKSHNSAPSLSDKPDDGNATPKVFPPRGRDRPPPTPHQYLTHRATMKRMYPEGWAPPRTISREAMESLREMNQRDPIQFRVPVLAAKFKISPEAVSRILKSKWQPPPERKAKLIARENMMKDKWIAEKIRAERAEAEKSLEGRWDPAVRRR
ncbi:hypothetical protein BDV93DRAFT_518427 [Ceratobasidium sp. AG-I]|nr:hypothetical protein BDV93DRAFT_518427 [Ceratobasidium sp. AG-I]